MTVDPRAARHLPSAGEAANREMRLFLAFAVQPVVAAVLGFAGFPLIAVHASLMRGGQPANAVDAATSVAAGAFVAALAVTVFVAAPVVLWYLRRGPLTLAMVLRWGAALGNLPAVTIWLLSQAAGSGRAPGGMPTDFGPWALARVVAMGAAFGIVGSGTFWVIAIRGTKDERSGAGGDQSRTHYANVTPAKAGARVTGVVFEVTASELQAADEYERSAGYRRIETTLASGKRAWVYLRPDETPR